MNGGMSQSMTQSLIPGMVGTSRQLLAACTIAAKFAPTASPVLIEGESGTGKEVLARGIHALSGRSGSFVPVNCGAIPADLLESELFGHERGSFTGAIGNRPGHFKSAQGGTIFLDEIGDMPQAQQVKLLRVLQNGEVKPVGADRPYTVDTRVVAASNVNITNRVGAGSFRQDLYYRLAVGCVTLPPLRERPEDIPALLRYFGEELSAKLPPWNRAERIDFGSLTDIAYRYHWPGNVRELHSVLERAMVLCAPTPEDLRDSFARQIPHERDDEVVQMQIALRAEQAGMDRGNVVVSTKFGTWIPLGGDWELAQMAEAQRALELTRGNRHQAAALLGMKRTTLVARIRRRCDLEVDGKTLPGVVKL